MFYLWGELRGAQIKKDPSQISHESSVQHLFSIQALHLYQIRPNTTERWWYCCRLIVRGSTTPCTSTWPRTDRWDTTANCTDRHLNILICFGWLTVLYLLRTTTCSVPYFSKSAPVSRVLILTWTCQRKVTHTHTHVKKRSPYHSMCWFTCMFPLQSFPMLPAPGV